MMGNSRVDPAIYSIRGRYRTNRPSFVDSFGYRYPSPGTRMDDSDREALVRFRASNRIQENIDEFVAEYRFDCMESYAVDADDTIGIETAECFMNKYRKLLENGDYSIAVCSFGIEFRGCPLLDVAAFGVDWDDRTDEDDSVIRCLFSKEELDLLNSDHASISLEGQLFYC